MFYIELDLMFFSFFNKSLNPAVIFTCTVTIKLVQDNTVLRKYRECQFLTILLSSKSDAMLNSK